MSSNGSLTARPGEKRPREEAAGGGDEATRAPKLRRTDSAGSGVPPGCGAEGGARTPATRPATPGTRPATPHERLAHAQGLVAEYQVQLRDAAAESAVLARGGNVLDVYERDAAGARVEPPPEGQPDVEEADPPAAAAGPGAATSAAAAATAAAAAAARKARPAPGGGKGKAGKKRRMAGSSSTPAVLREALRKKQARYAAFLGCEDDDDLLLGGGGLTKTQLAELEAKAAQDARTLNEVHRLRAQGLWSRDRLPKLPDPPRSKTHWDYVLEEMVWLSTDFAEERKWKLGMAKKTAKTVAKVHREHEREAKRAEEDERKVLRRRASAIAKQVLRFWDKVGKVVQLKHHAKLEAKRKAVQSEKMEFLVGQTERYSSIIATDLGGSASGAGSDRMEVEEGDGARAVARGSAGAGEREGADAGTGASTSSAAEPEPSASAESGGAGAAAADGAADEELEGKDERERIMTRAAAAASRAQPKGNTLESASVKTAVPALLRGTLREYQHIGLDWLVSMYDAQLNGILADEMGLGKTIQTISLLAHLACERGVWGPHLIVVPTSVMLNWEREFKMWCPGFKIVTYYGSVKERRQKRIGWSKPNAFHVCITSYSLILQDSHTFRRKRWHYLVLDEAQNIKNFKSQRWQTLLTFNSHRRLLLTGTPLQNNLMELWSLMHFLMPHIFQSHSEFKEWFSNPVSGMIEGTAEVNNEIIARLHGVLRPFLLRRLKKDVERQLPQKVERVIPCGLSKRQRFLYDEFISKGSTRDTLASGNYLGMMNVLMQLRKVCNHPDLFEPRPIVSPLDAPRLAYAAPAAVLEVAPSPVRRLLCGQLGRAALLDAELDSACSPLLQACASPGAITARAAQLAAEHTRESHADAALSAQLRTYLLEKRRREAAELQRCAAQLELVNTQRVLARPLVGRAGCRALTLPPRVLVRASERCDLGHVRPSLCAPFAERVRQREPYIERFCFAVPPARAAPVELVCSHPPPSWAARRARALAEARARAAPLTALFRSALVRQQLSFPERRLIQYDCGKLQVLGGLLRRLKAEGHRVLIFTQMSRMLDILEQFLNYLGVTYARLDGGTKPERRQMLMERFNQDARIFAFILSTRSGGTGVNLIGADTVVFYDSDWNPAMDAQAQDRCHRIGQTREVSIYRLISERTVEENILRKANQKRLLDKVAIDGGQFTTAFFREMNVRALISGEEEDTGVMDVEGDGAGACSDADAEQIQLAMAEAEDEVDRNARRRAARESAAVVDDWGEAAEAEAAAGAGAGANGIGGGISSAIGGSGSSEAAVDLKDPAAMEQTILSALSPVERYMYRFVQDVIPPIDDEQVEAIADMVDQSAQQWREETLRRIEGHGGGGGGGSSASSGADESGDSDGDSSDDDAENQDPAPVLVYQVLIPEEVHGFDRRQRYFYTPHGDPFSLPFDPHADVFGPPDPDADRKNGKHWFKHYYDAPLLVPRSVLPLKPSSAENTQQAPTGKVNTFPAAEKDAKAKSKKKSRSKKQAEKEKGKQSEKAKGKGKAKTKDKEKKKDKDDEGDKARDEKAGAGKKGEKKQKSKKATAETEPEKKKKKKKKGGSSAAPLSDADVSLLASRIRQSEEEAALLSATAPDKKKKKKKKKDGEEKKSKSKKSKSGSKSKADTKAKSGARGKSGGGKTLSLSLSSSQTAAGARSRKPTTAKRRTNVFHSRPLALPARRWYKSEDMALLLAASVSERCGAPHPNWAQVADLVSTAAPASDPLHRTPLACKERLDMLKIKPAPSASSSCASFRQVSTHLLALSKARRKPSALALPEGAADSPPPPPHASHVHAAKGARAAQLQRAGAAARGEGSGPPADAGDVTKARAPGAVAALTAFAPLSATRSDALWAVPSADGRGPPPEGSAARAASSASGQRATDRPLTSSRSGARAASAFPPLLHPAFTSSVPLLPQHAEQLASLEYRLPDAAPVPRLNLHLPVRPAATAAAVADTSYLRSSYAAAAPTAAAPPRRTSAPQVGSAGGGQPVQVSANVYAGRPSPSPQGGGRPGAPMGRGAAVGSPHMAPAPGAPLPSYAAHQHQHQHAQFAARAAMQSPAHGHAMASGSYGRGGMHAHAMAPAVMKLPLPSGGVREVGAHTTATVLACFCRHISANTPSLTPTVNEIMQNQALSETQKLSQMQQLFEQSLHRGGTRAPVAYGQPPGYPPPHAQRAALHCSTGSLAAGGGRPLVSPGIVPVQQRVSPHHTAAAQQQPPRRGGGAGAAGRGTEHAQGAPADARSADGQRGAAHQR